MAVRIVSLIFVKFLIVNETTWVFNSVFLKTTGKAVKSDEVLAFPADNDEETTRENQPRVTYTKVTISALNLTKFTTNFTKGNNLQY